MALHVTRLMLFYAAYIFLIACKHQKYTYKEGFTQASQYMQVRKTCCIIDIYKTKR